MRSRWTILAVLFVARAAMAFQFQSVAAVAPQYSQSLGASLADIGLLIGLYFAPGAALALPGGAIGRRLGDSGPRFRRSAIARDRRRARHPGLAPRGDSHPRPHSTS